ncbi:MAG: DASS family sodium-coupled anion symporter [Acidimicrobiales bacterium]|nr:DASS family sodium-coupled anion symporter [Acidimicrobiales bacterium]
MGGERARVAAIIAVALLAAIGLAAAAPAEWTGDSRQLEVDYLGDTVISTAVGSQELDFSAALGASASGSVSVSSAEGFAPDATFQVLVTVTDPQHEAQLGDIEVRLVGPGDQTELVPVLSSDGGTFDASRRAPVKAGVLLAVLGLAVVLWITELAPLFVTSLAIPVALAAAQVGPARDVLAPFFDPIIVLFFGGFLMAEAMRRVGLDQMVAVTIVDKAGRGPVRLYLAMLGLAAFLSMWMSNTAAVTVLIPIAMAVSEPLDSPSYRKTLVLGIAYAATIGGVGSAIGTPANPLAITFIERLTGRQISFVEWFAFGLPVVFVLVPVMALYLWRVGRVSVDAGKFSRAADIAASHRVEFGRFTTQQMQVLGVFSLVMVLWLTQSFHEVNTGIVALGGAVVLFVLGLLEPEDVGKISWPTLLTFGGGLTLGSFMVRTGTSDWIVTRLSGVADWPEMLAVALVAMVALGLTTVASNTATAATLIPLAIPLAGLIGAEPVLLVVVIAVASSIDFALVIGTPPTMLAYDTKLFTAREILGKGAPLDAIGIVVLLVAAVPIWTLLGLL